MSGSDVLSWRERIQARIPGFRLKVGTRSETKPTKSDHSWNDREQALLDSTPTLLASTGLIYWWKSCPIRAWQTYFSPPRPWTVLNDETRRLLIDDVAESDSSGEGRFFSLAGLDPALAPETVDDEWFRDELGRFSPEGNSAIRIVIINPGDQLSDFLFVPHTCANSLQPFFQSLGIADPANLRRTAYKKLNMSRLECLYELS